jgi:hypothetical protein
MNVNLLESVRQSIARHPDRFSAAQWAFARNADRVLEEGAPPDGFRCCIAGHVLLESGGLSERDLLREGGFHTGGALWDRAAVALDAGEEQCRELFFPSQWDRPFKQKYYLCTRDEEARVATAYLDYFVGKHAPESRRRPSVAAPDYGSDRPPRVSQDTARSAVRVG